MQRRVLERWSALFGACALAGAFYHYTLFSVTARVRSGELESALRDTVNGHVAAPFQYRFLVPCLLVWLNDHVHVSLATATTLVDGTAVTIGAVLGVALLRRTGLGLYASPALLYCAVLVLGPILYYKPETMTAFSCITAALLALQRRSPADGWWSGTVVWSALVIAAAVLIGCRTDLLLGLAVGFAVRGWQRRERVDMIAAVLLGVTAVVATLVLIRLYPDAHYPQGIGVVQLTYNFDALTIVVLGVFLAAAVGPLIALRGPAPMSAAARGVVSERLPLLALITTEVASTFVVGRVDEIRLLFPVAFALAWVGADLWRALIGTVDLEGAPVA